MKRAAILPILLVPCLTLAAPGLKEQLKSWNTKLSAAMLTKNVADIRKFMHESTAPGFQYTEQGAKGGLEPTITKMVAGISMMKQITLAKMTVLSLHETGKTATGSSRHEIRGIMLGGDKKPHTIGFVGTTNDTYVKLGDAWKLKTMAWTDEKQSFDGKPVVRTR